MFVIREVTIGTTSTTTNSSQTATATPQESKMEDIELQRLENNQGNQQSLDTNMYNTMNTILTGGTLPGTMAGVNGISEDQTQSMVNQSLRDIMPQFQSSGILNSGEAAQVANQTGALVRNQNAQFNTTALQNLFNIATGSSSNLSNSTTAQNQTLGNQLSGLRTVNNSSSVTSNPFLNSFYSSGGTSAGKTVGNLGSSAVSAGLSTI